jgi:Bacterial Ig-like domain (group 1)
VGRLSKRRVLGVAATSVAIVAATALPAAAAIVTTDDAVALADAMVSPTVVPTGAAFEELPPLGTPHAVSDTPLAGFPTDGPTYSILTSGDATLADQPNNSPSSGADIGGGSVRGNTDFDVSVLRIDFVVPTLLNCMHFDFKFLSEEFPEYVGQSVNDAFIAELDRSTWTTVNSEIEAPDNFAFDQNGEPITINTSGVTAMNAANAAGTTYDGATPVLTAGHLITPGPHSLFLSIFDQGDHVFDSAVFADHLTLTFAPTPEDCPEGSVVRQFNLDLAPPTAINEPGDTHTVTATVTDVDTHGPVAGGVVLFSVNGANPTTGTDTTDADGEATFTYTGNTAGQDAITACLDINLNGTCDEPNEPVASVLKTWQVAPPTLTLTPATATNVVGTTHTLTANVVDGTGAPIVAGRVLFEVTGTNHVTGTEETNGAGNATFTYSGNGVGDDEITACFDANGNTVCDPNEARDTATKTWVLAGPAVTLTPATATNPVGSLHTLIATATSTVDGEAMEVQNARVVFVVAGANPQTGEAFTDDNGRGEFAYLGTAAGTDTITACVDVTGNDACDPGEPSDTATKMWVPTTMELNPPAATNFVGEEHTLTGTLTETPSGAPVAGAHVLIIVTGANAGPPAGSPQTEGTTDRNGKVTITYRGRATGTDTITVCQDVNLNRRCDDGEATATATKTWAGLPITGMRLAPVVGSAVAFVLLGSAMVAGVLMINKRRRGKFAGE